MRYLQKMLVCLCLITSFGLSAPAMAMSVAEAKNAGLVGEQSNGYLAAVQGNPSSTIRSLISSTNQKRRNAYISRAQKAGVSLEVMEQRIGQRLLQKAASGHYFRTGKGSWQKK